MIHENLLPAHRIARRKVHRCMNSWLMALGVLSVLTGGSIIGAHITKALPPVMPAGLTQDIELAQTELQDIELQIEELERTRRAFQQSESAPYWDRLLQIIARKASGHTQLKSIQVATASADDASWTVSIHGSASDRQSSATFVAALESTGLFSSVRRRSAPALGTDDRTEFFLDCSINP